MRTRTHNRRTRFFIERAQAIESDRRARPLEGVFHRRLIAYYCFAARLSYGAAFRRFE